MRAFNHLLLILAAPVFMGVLLAPLAVGETLRDTVSTEGGPIVIKSKTLEVDDTNKVVTFTGSVRAKKDDFVIDCETLYVFYKRNSEETDATEPSAAIDRIVAAGNVTVTRAKGGTATAGKAVYYQEDEKVVLTETPVVSQGKNFVEGDRITLFLKENRSVVESSGDNKVKAVIHPGEEKE